jgi:hypothetical protein
MHYTHPSHTHNARPPGSDGPLSLEEVAIISGALELTATPTSAAMTPLEEAFTLKGAGRVDAALVDEVLRRGVRQVLVVGAGEGGGGPELNHGSETGAEGDAAAAAADGGVLGAVSTRDVLAHWAAAQAAANAASAAPQGISCSGAVPDGERVRDLPLARMHRVDAVTPLHEVLMLFRKVRSGLPFGVRETRVVGVVAGYALADNINLPTQLYRTPPDCRWLWWWSHCHQRRMAVLQRTAWRQRQQQQW